MNVLAFDLDKTLNDNGARLPLCDRVNELFEHPDNFIVIYTARSYVIFHETRQWLIRNGVKHHALVCEKLRADCYIDDKGVTTI